MLQLQPRTSSLLRSLVAAAICFISPLYSGASLTAAEEPTAEQKEFMAKLKEEESKLTFLDGKQELKGGVATVAITPEFSFLQAKDAQTALTNLWGNPPDSGVLGMIVPKGMSLTDETAWAVVVSYEEDGYVKDEDAAKLNYDDVLKDMKEGMAEANKERAKAGYDSIEVVGWATPPHYDATEKKLYWAKELAFGGSPEHTLNYNIRALGRRGVLVLNAVAGMERLPDIEKATPAILNMVEFNEGHRYSDFNPSVDKVAAYGIGGLIAGKVLAKAGLFKVLLVFLAKGWKLVAVGLVALGGIAKKFFGRTA